MAPKVSTHEITADGARCERRVRTGEAGRRVMRVALTGLQLVVGAVIGWFVSVAVLFSTPIACRIVGIPPKVGDLVAIAVMILCAASSVVAVTLFYNRRCRWLAPALGFGIGATVFAFFAVVVVIPFGASMRDFD
ncbi:MAG: hypothetical protein PGN29_12245 [Gordonia paraffinivorans]